ncbi:MAG: cytochrome d ubiquinol oxidase subunit II [Burkholderiales bacterium]|nr:cytochrome d ubiquinol oxidase subunit II [Burkholderiales bacterium]MDQ3196845.1 cytochrome d ubiquinol oxidase subunit II [Pseudomonadota bacterium]
MLEQALPLIWYWIIGFGIFMYVLLDGFVLGIGILFPTVPHEHDRDVMMNTVAPIWDGNETWLVLGGAALFAAFPVAYAVILPALYLPLLGMLMALIFRGVAFEFRFKSGSKRYLWNIAFFGGSLVATFWQGVALGAFVQGFEVVDRQYGGGSFDWLTPFALFTGLALIAGYALLGATWLIMKAEGELQDRAYRYALLLLYAVLAGLVVISIWVPFLDPKIAERWFSWPNMALFAPAPLFTAVAAFTLWNSVRKRHTYSPFILAMALFLLGYAGLGISIWPNIVPPDITIWEGASPPESQMFLLVGIVFLFPVILGYTAYSYWIFRGKVTRETGYHH